MIRELAIAFIDLKDYSKHNRLSEWDWNTVTSHNQNLLLSLENGILTLATPPPLAWAPGVAPAPQPGGLVAPHKEVLGVAYRKPRPELKLGVQPGAWQDTVVFPGSEERVFKVERWDNLGTKKPDLLCYDEFWKSVPLLIMRPKFRAEFFPPLVKLLCSGDVRILVIEEIKIRFSGSKGRHTRSLSGCIETYQD